jgi:PAS domain S-box-containing protein
MAISESYAWVKMLVDTSFASRFLIASDAKILFANAAAEALFGYSDDELTGKPIDVIFSAASDRKLALPPLDSPVRMITADDQEIKGRTKDGRELILRVGTTPFRTLTGTFLAVTVFDITKCKQVEKEPRARKPIGSRQSKNLAKNLA